MVLWVIVEAAVSTVAAYNFVKGAYNMYRDAEEIKEQYRQHQKATEDYIRVQTNGPKDLSQSQYCRFEGEFLILDVNN